MNEPFISEIKHSKLFFRVRLSLAEGSLNRRCAARILSSLASKTRDECGWSQICTHLFVVWRFTRYRWDKSSSHVSQAQGTRQKERSSELDEAYGKPTGPVWLPHREV